jgi:N-acetylglucosamine kinase-like BadF-type ATPase
MVGSVAALIGQTAGERECSRRALDGFGDPLQMRSRGPSNSSGRPGHGRRRDREQRLPVPWLRARACHAAVPERILQVNRKSLVTLPAELVEPAPRADARYLLGVDGGATKTLAGVLDLDERVLHLAGGGPSNEDAVGPGAAVGTLVDTAERAIERAGIAADDLAAAVVAVAGTDTDAVSGQVRERRPAWIVVNDVVGAWATATGAGPGVGVISGTGSNVFGVGRDARAWRAGGWGHVLGDEGSGYWFGVQSIKAALRDRESSGPPTALSDAVVAYFDAPSIEALAARVYAKPMSKGEIAAFAVETARVAEAGDEVARGLFELGARELGAQIQAVIRETGLTGEFPVGLVGGNYKAGGMFIEPLTRAVRQVAPEARVATAEMVPVGGALLLAARACGRGELLERQALAQLIVRAL